MIDFINESDMKFVSDNVFHIEKSQEFTILGDNVKSVEFVRVRDNDLMFIEAKTSFPNPNNPVKGNAEKFESEILEICDKFNHSLNLFASLSLGVSKNTIPEALTLPENLEIVFVLVIKNHNLKWCKAIRDGIMITLPLYFKRIWKPTVFVINQAVAVRQGLAE